MHMIFITTRRKEYCHSFAPSERDGERRMEAWPWGSHIYIIQNDNIKKMGKVEIELSK